ncbi:hypothetical protein HK102_008922 [Quaeritorhiza haematococci]|nr:hypothetical protein HK102_008922 [Quaeritorhiza haematococci]
MTSTATASLPQEIWTYVYSYLKGSDPYNFALSCRKFAQVSRDPHARALLIINRCGGARLALYWVLMEVLDERILGVVRGRTTTSSSNGGPTFAFEITRQQRLAAQQRRLREGLGDGDDSPRRLAKLAGALTPEVATLLFQAGSILPRLLCQRCVREVGSLPSTALFTWIVGKSYQLYGEEAALDGDDQDWVSSLMTELEQRKISLQAQQQNYADGVSGGYDHAQFEESWRAVLAETASLSAAHTKLSDLITKYSFVPFPLNTPNSAYFLYRMSFIDLSLVDALVRNGLVLHSSSVNDEVMKWVLRKGNAQAISAYLEHGFRLTSAVVTLALQLARPEIMDSLQQFLTAEELQSYAEDAVFELLGPTRLCTTDTLLDHLRGTYNISEEVMARALLQVPEGAGYRTRPFMQQHPATAWRWALKAYGAHHRFSDAVFDDVLQKLASGKERIQKLHLSNRQHKT